MWRRRLPPCTLAYAAMFLLAPAAAAHQTDEVPGLATAWTIAPWLHVPLAWVVAAYGWSLARRWRRTGWAGALGLAQLLAFTGAIVALLLATLWPLDALGEWSLAAHMGQHVLLLAVVPPLLMVARTGTVLATLLPVGAVRWWQQQVPKRRWNQWLALAPGTVLHCAVMWGWHLPAAIGAALGDDGIHWLMHASFLVAGVWFWSAVFHRSRDAGAGVAAALVGLVVVMMQMGLMGALLTFSTRPLYSHYAVRAPQLGLDALADQQLAGLLMWVPACLPYLLAGVWLLGRGLGRDARSRSSQH